MIQTKLLPELKGEDSTWAGSKAVRLGELGRAGFSIPAGLAIGADAYQRFVESTGLLESIQLMLHRKKFEDMRWEELWDLALRVRNLFARTAVPPDLRRDLEDVLRTQPFTGRAVVRSAGLNEDSRTASFAGLHDSFINVQGTDEIIEKIVLVWASLWSDRALLYRKELGLNPMKSRIAVIVQELVQGTASGVAFSRSPSDKDELLIEAVWGLNQGMVDGTVAAHRWHLSRQDGQVKQFIAVDQIQALSIEANATKLVPLVPEKRGAAPLQKEKIGWLYKLVIRIEKLFQEPQDIEWTLSDNEFVLLQSRPITTGANDEAEDKRRWYLTLHRSIDNLTQLRETILGDVLPGMETSADGFASMDPGTLDPKELVLEVKRRQAARDHWVEAYWKHCIPFAHGMRIFGQIYNDHCKPDDPFEFVELLRNDALLVSQRNTAMQGLSRDLTEVREGRLETEVFEVRLDAFLDRYGLNGLAGTPQDRKGLITLLGRLSTGYTKPVADESLKDRFLNRFSGEQRESMARLLDLARDSYSLRDDDNIYLGRIEAQLVAALQEVTRRVGGDIKEVRDQKPVTELLELLEDPTLAKLVAGPPEQGKGAADFELRARQLVGQPATPGIAVGQARVITDSSSLLSFRQGEILVCDAINPNMTFVAPLAAGIVERRGGMLIHGAIIAREYGIPCVTGVPDAAAWIRTGDTVSVDGYLGLVTVSAPVS